MFALPWSMANPEVVIVSDRQLLCAVLLNLDEFNLLLHILRYPLRIQKYASVYFHRDVELKFDLPHFCVVSCLLLYCFVLLLVVQLNSSANESTKRVGAAVYTNTYEYIHL